MLNMLGKGVIDVLADDPELSSKSNFGDMLSSLNCSIPLNQSNVKIKLTIFHSSQNYLSHS